MPASAQARTFDVKRIAIIGAGPSGLAAAKYLRGEQHFQHIDIFEQRSRVGGVWDYDPGPKTFPEDFNIPQTSPRAGLAKPVWSRSGTKQALGDRDGDFRWLSPMYDRLETNIPRTLMGFSDLDWPQDSQLFPKHETVTAYIEKYAQEVKSLIKFNTQVVQITPVESLEQEGHGWRVRTRDVREPGEGDDVREDVYDAVVAASGHFAVPFIPAISGLDEFRRRYPGAVSHSMYYKQPEQYKDKVSQVNRLSRCIRTNAELILYRK